MPDASAVLRGGTVPDGPRGTLRVHTLIDSLTWGGAEGLLADLAVAAPSADIELSVGFLQDVDGSPSAAALRTAGVEPELVGTARVSDPRSLLRVRAHLARRAPDVVHTHLASADLLGGLAARSLGIPSVCTIHLVGTSVVTAAAGRRGEARERLADRTGRRAAARIIAVSDAARTAYLARSHAAPGRVVVVHNGIARAPSSRPTAAVRSELGVDADVPLVVMVGVLRAGKGHDVAMEALATLHEHHPRTTLVVVGDGPDRAGIAALAAPLGDRVVLAGHRGDVLDVLGAADVLLHPTRMDAFPTVLLEAACAGLPVVATRVGGVPELVDDGATGILVDPPPRAADLAAALDTLLADRQLHTRMAGAARARFVASSSATAWAGRLREVYDTVRSGTH